MLKPRFMKYLLALSLIFLSIIAFSQNKDTTIKAKSVHCRISLAGKFGLATDSTSIEDILADPIVRGDGCDNFTITSFEMVTNIHNTFTQNVSTSDHLSKEMIHTLKQVFEGTPIIIQSVHYKMTDGRTGVTPGLILSINK